MQIKAYATVMIPVRVEFEMEDKPHTLEEFQKAVKDEALYVASYGIENLDMTRDLEDYDIDVGGITLGEGVFLTM